MGLLTKKKVITIKKPVKKTEQKKKSSFSFFKSKKDKQNKDTAQEIFKTNTIKKNKPKEKFTYKFLMTKQKNNSTNQSEKPTPSSNFISISSSEPGFVPCIDPISIGLGK